MGVGDAHRDDPTRATSDIAPRDLRMSNQAEFQTIQEETCKCHRIDCFSQAISGCYLAAQTLLSPNRSQLGVSLTRSAKKRDGAVREGCRPTKPIRLRHQRNKRPREPHSSFATKITALAYSVTAQNWTVLIKQRTSLSRVLHFRCPLHISPPDPCPRASVSCADDDSHRRPLYADQQLADHPQQVAT